MRRLSVVLSLIVLLFCGCQNIEKPAPPVPKPEPLLLSEPAAPIVMELPSEAIPVWREALPQPGTLVLMSIHPFLQPIEAERAAEVAALVRSGDRETFRQRGSFYRADPALVPTETVSGALLGGLFKEVIWIFPVSTPVEQLSLETFRKQLTEAKFLTDEEAAKLTLDAGVFTGTVRGVPFRAVHPQTLPKLDGPFALHIDLGYFRGLYQGEVKTPLYDVLHESCQGLKTAGWRPQVVTLSYSTIEGQNSHDVRFLLTNLAEILRNHKLLDEMPASWAKRGEALYAVNFFLDSKVREMYQQNAADNPKDAAAQYDYYRSLFEQKKVTEALTQLDKAVALDSGYAAAYLELAQIAEKDGNLAVAAELLGKGGRVFPENPFIDLYRARFLLQIGQVDEAKPLISRLQQLTWSKRLHGQIPEAIIQMSDYVKNPQAAKSKSVGQK